MYQYSATFFLILALGSQFLSAPAMASATSAAAGRPSVAVGLTAGSDVGVTRSALQGAPGESPTRIFNQEELPRLIEDMTTEIRITWTHLDRGIYAAAAIRLGQKLPSFRQRLGLNASAGNDALFLKEAERFEKCEIEDGIQASVMSEKIAAMLVAEGGPSYARALDLVGKVEAMLHVTEFLAGTVSRTAELNFAQNFLNATTLPLHITRPAPSNANMGIVFLADINDGAGEPEFFDALLSIPAVAQALGKNVPKLTGVRISRSGTLSTTEFYQARSAWMVKYHQQQLAYSCESAPGAFLLSSL